MGNKYPAHEPMAWAEAKWDNTDENDQDEAQPGAADAVRLTANSRDLAVPANGECASVDMTGYTTGIFWNTEGVTLDVGGQFGGSVDATVYNLGTIQAQGVWFNGTIDWGSYTGDILIDVAGGNLGLGTGADNGQSVEINHAGVTTVRGDFRCHKFTATAGQITGGDHTITVRDGGLD